MSLGNLDPSPVGALSDEDRSALLRSVSDFAVREIEARRPRPEHALTADDFRDITQAADDAGLLDTSADGYGLWSTLSRGCDSTFTLAALQQLAMADAAAAWHLHGVALGRAALALAGLPAVAAPAFTLDGAYGIGRSAMGRFLAGRPLHSSDRAILDDCFGDRSRLTLVAPTVGHVVALHWQSDALGVAAHDLTKVSIGRDESPHGLDGCVQIRWKAGQDQGPVAQMTVAEVGRILAAQQLAQVAIARGAVERAGDRAHTYASMRMQGGRNIARHDAVALLLADIDTATTTVDALLGHAGMGPLDAQRAVAIRREAAPMLCRAANASMQVHGGVGYMRDTGIEHLLRDTNTLRLLGGAPVELGLVAAGFASDEAALPEDLPGSSDHLPGHLPADHPLSPATAFKGVPLLRSLSQGPACEPWEADTRSLPRSLANLRRKVRRFAEQECAPLAESADLALRDGHESGPALRTLVERAGRAGLLTELLPAPFGSASIRRFAHSVAFQQAIQTEELARVDGGLMLLLSAHSLGVCPVLLSGDLGLIRRVVVPAFRATRGGDPQVFAFAITEPSSGSDVEDGHGALHQQAGVVAKRVASGWELHGRKVFISGGDIARYVAVFAALDDGSGNEGFQSWTCFLVDTTTPGFSVARNEVKMGMRASGASELEFGGCFVPDDMVVGGLRNGWALARATLNLSRIPVAAMAVGFAQQAVDIATEFACSETLAGRPLVHARHVQATLADLQAETSAIRSMVWHHARSWQPRQAASALCKFQATDRAQVVVETAMDLLGSAAVAHDKRIERSFRDVRLTRIFEGTNQINRLAVIEDQQQLLLDQIAAVP